MTDPTDKLGYLAALRAIEANKKNPQPKLPPMRRRSDENCQPCGGCRWCKSNFRAKDRAKQLDPALALLDKLADALQDQINAAMPCMDHPTFRRHQRLVTRAVALVTKTRTSRNPQKK